MAVLEVLNGPEVGHKVELAQETFFIGRDSNNHLVLTDRTVSRRHAVINLLEGRYVLSDLKSLKGILINGVKTGETALEHGDEIAIGAVRLRFHGEDKKTAIPFPKKRQGSFWIPIALIGLLSVAAGIFFWQKEEKIRTTEVDLAAVQENYEEGIRLFNEERDIAGARELLKNVLRLDPEKTTPQAHKALKLLENLE